MELKFVLRKDKVNKNGLCPIRMDISINGQRIRKTVSGVKSSVSDWKGSRLKVNLKNDSYEDNIDFNEILENIEIKVNSIFRYIRKNKLTVDKDYILEKLNDEHFGNNEVIQDFFSMYQEYIDRSKNIVVPGSIRRYKSNRKFFQNFEEFTGYKMRFETINLEFYEKLTNYCFEEKQTVNNYFGKLVTGLKAFMNWAYDREYHNNDTFKKFKAPKDRIEVIYLSIEELMSLYRFDFNDKKLEKVRDFYCFSCFSGLRYSDVSKLKTSNIFENHIKFNIQKTKTIDHITPLNKFSKEILVKYKGTIYEPIPKISAQKLNDYIKIACEKAKINSLVNITRYMGQKRIDKEVPKYELITSHTAKKTFVTNSLILGMKESVIQQITGNQDKASFKAYVDIANSLKYDEMNNSWNKL